MDDAPSESEAAWRALEALLRAAVMIARGNASAGAHRVQRLQAAKAELGEALLQIEDAVIQAEGAEIPAEGNGDD